MRKEIVDMRRKTYIINNIAVGRTVVSMYRVCTGRRTRPIGSMDGRLI